ncbi:MAG: diguanylate cyclase [Helicobacteraceae bacterium]|nr:diguanylate cyclase [Helicobacteraceae bacterium]
MNLFLKLLTIVTILISNIYAQEELTKVKLQLQWKYQFEFAGFIVAKEKGFYKDLGLDVDIVELKNGVDLVDELLSKRVDFALMNSPLIYRDKKLQDVVLLATYLQKSPLIFVTQKEITEPSQFVDKKIMGTVENLGNSSLSLLMDHFFINSKNSTFVPHTFNIEKFKNREVDVMAAFRSNELYFLEKENIEFNVIDPADYGFVTNAINLFSTYEKATTDSLEIKNFLAATKKGWLYAIENTQEVVEIIHTKYTSQKSIDELLHEASIVKSLMLIDLHEVGETNCEYTTRLYKQLVKSDKVLKNQKLDKLTFNDILREIKAQTITLTKKERAYIKKKEPIKLCVDPDWMPFESIQNSEHIGIAADLFKILKDKSNIKMEVVQTTNWAESIKAAKNRECDVYTLAASTPKRLKYMDFTTSYVDLPIVLATKIDKPFIENFSSIRSKRIGIVKGYAIAESLRAMYSDINIVDVETVTQGLEMVESGQLYGYIDNLMVIASYIQKNFTGSLKISSRLNENVELAIGTRNDQPILHDIFQKLVNSITEVEKQHVYNDWVSIEVSSKIDYTPIIKIFAIVALLLMAFMYHYKTLRDKNEKLRILSHTDKLTGINNRLHLDEILDEQYELSKRYEHLCAVIILDIDYFKNVNDSYGHLVGDKVLKEFTSIIKTHIRSTDIVGRWGGEEFLIILPHTDINNSLSLAQTLRKIISEYNFNDGNLHISASFGISSFNGNKSVEQVVLEADKALYQAKESGRNCAAIYE